MESMDVNFWRGQNVFVTGGSGLLGSQIVKELSLRQAAVTCLVHQPQQLSHIALGENNGQINLVYGQLDEPGLLVRILNEYEITSVFHLAAFSVAEQGLQTPVASFESNIAGTWNLLAACLACQGSLERVVVASSGAAYGTRSTRPFSEDTPLGGRSPYAVSKACADLIAASYFHSFDVPVAIARCAYLYGGGDRHVHRIVPATILAALRGDTPSIPVPANLSEEYLYVVDAVDAYLTLAEQLPEKQLLGHAFNFSSEYPISALDLIARILHLMGRQELASGKVDEESPPREGLRLNCSKAKAMLGWRPRHTLDEGLARTIAWYKNQYEVGK